MGAAESVPAAGSAQTFIQKVDALKAELGVSDGVTVAESVATVAEMLGVQREGKTLTDVVD